MRKAGLTLDQIKSQILLLKGSEVEMNVNRGRKKFDKLNGIIKDVYPSVFTVASQENQIQTFSYYDVLCGNVVFFLKDYKEMRIFSCLFLFINS